MPEQIMEQSQAPVLSERSLDIAVLMLGSLTSMGGYQVFTYNLLHRLHAHGHQVTLYITKEEYNSRRRFYETMPFTVRPLLRQTIRLLHYLPLVPQTFLCWLQKKYRHDVWQVIGAYPAAFLAFGLCTCVPVVCRGYGDDIQIDRSIGYGLRLDPKLEPRIRQAVCALDTAVAMTPSMAECFRALGLPQEKICAIANGFDVARFSERFDRDAVLRTHDVDPEKSVILTVGRRHPKKNYEIIPEIAKRLVQSGTEFTWLVVGKDTQVIEQEAKNLGLENTVRSVEEIGVAGFGNNNVQSEDNANRPEVPATELVRLYQAADIFVFPSKLEGFPRVLFEAMAAGTPVVTTDAPGCCDVAIAGKNALVCSPDDINGYVKAIQSVLNDDRLRQNLISGGLESANACDFEQITNQYVDTYRKVIAQKNKSAAAMHDLT